MLKFRSEALDGARNQLGQMVLALADSFNQQHRAGFDIHGEPGGDFFSFSGGRVVENSRNSGDAELSVSYTDTGKVQASDYRVEFDGSNWQVTRLSDNVKVNATPAPTLTVNRRWNLKDCGSASTARPIRTTASPSSPSAMWPAT